MHDECPCLKIFRVIGKPFWHPPCLCPRLQHVAGNWPSSRDTRGNEMWRTFFGLLGETDLDQLSWHSAFLINGNSLKIAIKKGKCTKWGAILYPHKSLLCHNNPVIEKFDHYPLWSRPFVMIAIFSRALLATINKASVPGDSGPILQRDLVTTIPASDWSEPC